MKPSEFILKTRYLEMCPENKLHRKILDDFTLNDLDKRFIDREEFKDKIKNYKMKKVRIELEDFKKEILELLK